MNTRNHSRTSPTLAFKLQAVAPGLQDFNHDIPATATPSLVTNEPRTAVSNSQIAYFAHKTERQYCPVFPCVPVGTSTNQERPENGYAAKKAGFFISAAANSQYPSADFDAAGGQRAAGGPGADGAGGGRADLGDVDCPGAPQADAPRPTAALSPELIHALAQAYHHARRAAELEDETPGFDEDGEPLITDEDLEQAHADWINDGRGFGA